MEVDFIQEMSKKLLSPFKIKYQVLVNDFSKSKLIYKPYKIRILLTIQMHFNLLEIVDLPLIIMHFPQLFFAILNTDSKNQDLLHILIFLSLYLNKFLPILNLFKFENNFGNYLILSLFIFLRILFP